MEEKDNELAKINVSYFLDGEQFALQNTAYIPCVNDGVRFNHKLYLVISRVWIHDETLLRVAVDIEEEGEL